MPCEVLPRPDDAVDCGRDALRCHVGGDLGGLRPSALVLLRVLGLGEREDGVLLVLWRLLRLRERGRLAHPAGKAPDTGFLELDFASSAIFSSSSSSANEVNRFMINVLVPG